MMYNYIKLADDTQIAHSNILEDQTVQVSICLLYTSDAADD